MRTGADVAEIIVADGRASGVKLATGETLTASRGVICSVTPTQLLERLLPEASAGENRARAKDYRYGKGDMQIHYALKNPPRWKNPAGPASARGPEKWSDMG